MSVYKTVSAAIQEHEKAVRKELSAAAAQAKYEDDLRMSHVLRVLDDTQRQLYDMSQTVMTFKNHYKKLARNYRRDTNRTSRFWYALAQTFEQAPGYEDPDEFDEEELAAIYDQSDEPDEETDEMKEAKRRKSWGEWLSELADPTDSRFDLDQQGPRAPNAGWFMKLTPVIYEDETVSAIKDELHSQAVEEEQRQWDELAWYQKYWKS